MAAIFDTTDYVNAAGEEPSGQGFWCFGLQPNARPSDPDTFSAPALTTYPRAKALARAAFAGRGVQRIYVLA